MSGDEENVVSQDDLWSKLVAMDRKRYFFDLRENVKGRYLKVTEVSSRHRSTVVMSPKIVSMFREVLEGSLEGKFTEEGDDTTDEVEDGEERPSSVVYVSRYGELGAKKYFVDMVRNARGKMIKVAEVQASRGRAVIVFVESGWAMVKETLDTLCAEFPDFLTPSSDDEDKTTNSKNIHNDKVENGKTDRNDVTPHEAGDGSNASNNSSYKRGSKRPVPVTIAEVSNSADEGGNKVTLMTRVMKTSLKRFFFDLLENENGRYLKVAQLSNGHRETVVLPSESWPLLAQLLQAYLDDDITREIEDLEVANTHTTSTSPSEINDTAEENNNNSSNSRKKPMKKRPPPRKSSSTLNERLYRASNGKTFYIDLRENPYGRFLKMAEVKNAAHHQRASVAIPDICFHGFKQVLDEFVSCPPSS